MDNNALSFLLGVLEDYSNRYIGFGALFVASLLGIFQILSYEPLKKHKKWRKIVFGILFASGLFSLFLTFAYAQKTMMITSHIKYQNITFEAEWDAAFSNSTYINDLADYIFYLIYQYNVSIFILISIFFLLITIIPFGIYDEWSIFAQSQKSRENHDKIYKPAIQGDGVQTGAKFQIKTEIQPMTKLGKLVSFLSRDGKAIEANVGKIISTFTALDNDTNLSISVLPEIRTQGIDEQYSSSYTETMDLQILKEGSKYEWTTTFPSAGLCELRIYLKDLPDDIKVLDDFGGLLGLKGIGYLPAKIPSGTRFYLKQIRVYSLYELLLFLFAGLSMIGAIFEVFNFIFK